MVDNRTLENNKALVRRSYEEVWSKGQIDEVVRLYGPDFILVDPLAQGVRGPEGYRQYVLGLRIPFPDLCFTVEEQIAEGDQVATRWRAQGTQQGEFMGIPPTGKVGEITGTTISRIVAGQIVEEKSNWDALLLLQTLGVIPERN